jgi:sugar O-acyltransferase (sialic acid O-acetyltransferase NeuD family)
MKPNLVIIGASGHGKVCANIAYDMNQWEEIYFLDDNENITQALGFPIIGNQNIAHNHRKTADFFIGIGHNQIRMKLQQELIARKFTLATLIHPSAQIGLDVKIGLGTAIMAGVIINCSVEIGNGCIINTASVVDHDGIIEDFVHLSPSVNLAGNVKIGKRSWLGIGSSAINNIQIARNVIIGAQSLVTKDIEKPGTYVGIPVKKEIKSTLTIPHLDGLLSESDEG